MDQLVRVLNEWRKLTDEMLVLASEASADDSNMYEKWLLRAWQYIGNIQDSEKNMTDAHKAMDISHKLGEYYYKSHDLDKTIEYTLLQKNYGEVIYRQTRESNVLETLGLAYQRLYKCYHGKSDSISELQCLKDAVITMESGHNLTQELSNLYSKFVSQRDQLEALLAPPVQNNKPESITPTLQNQIPVASKPSFCSQCGNMVVPGAKFCAYCGNRLWKA